MKYYSEELNRTFDTEDECRDAETEYLNKIAEAKKQKEALKAEKKSRADEVSDSFKAYKEAEKKYIELRNQFIKDYGYYHMTYSDSEDTSDFDLRGVLDELFNFKKLF